MRNESYRVAYLPGYLICGLGLFAVGLSQLTGGRAYGDVTDLDYIILITLLYGSLGVIGAFVAVRSLFLRVKISKGRLTHYRWLGKEDIKPKRAWPVISNYSVLPAWAPACRTEDGEVEVLQMVARYGVPFSGKPPRSIIKMCDTINHNARVVGIFDDVPDESEEALPAVSSSDELSKD